MTSNGAHAPTATLTERLGGIIGTVLLLPIAIVLLPLFAIAYVLGLTAHWAVRALETGWTHGS